MAFSKKRKQFFYSVLLFWYKARSEKARKKKTRFINKNNFDKAAKYRKKERKYLEKTDKIRKKSDNFPL